MDLISLEEWEAFFKSYTYDFLRDPNYRLGQAFCNYFGDFVNTLDQTHLLFYQTDNREAFKIIKGYIDGEVDVDELFGRR